MSPNSESPTPALIAALRRRQDWGPAVAHFTATAAANPHAVQHAANFGTAYAGDPAAAVVDVIFSRQRDYEKVVAPGLAIWRATHPAMPLAALTAQGPGDIHRLQAAEATTITTVAGGLSRYGSERGLGDAAALTQWAADVRPLRFAPRLEPYVGSVPGIGVALFAYLRMFGGADAIKPDVRVRKALQRAGLSVPNDPVAVLTMAEAMAMEVGLAELVFDQLCWY